MEKTTCKKCNRNFKTIQARAGHQAHCNKNNKVRCNICDNEYNISSFKSHLLSHRKDKPCLVCNTITSNPKYCSSSCSAIDTNKKKAKERYCLNCKKSIKRTINKYCSTDCQTNYQHKEKIKNWKNGIPIKNINTPKWLRMYLFEKYNNKCCKCGWNEINSYSNKQPLEVEHIDGNSTNNKEENLELLCPNCHSLTPTYRALNTGNGRLNRRKRYAENKSY